MIRMQQGCPAGTPWEQAVADATANALRHYPGAAVGATRRIETPAHVAAGEFLVELELSGDLTAVDLTDPEVVRQKQIDQAKAAMAVLDEAAQTEVLGGLQGEVVL